MGIMGGGSGSGGAPSGAAGGGLSGTYPNPTVATVWTATSADELVSDAAGADGFVVRTAADSIAARSFGSSDRSLLVINPTGSGGPVDLTVAAELRPITLYTTYAVVLPQGTTFTSDGAGTFSSAGVYGTNVSTEDFKCVRLGDSGSFTCRFYVDAKTRLEEGTISIDFAFRLGSDVSGSTQHYAIGLTSNIAFTSADPTGSRAVIKYSTGGGNWLLSTKDGTTNTETDTYVPVTAGYFYVMRMEASATQVRVKIGRGSTISAAKIAYDAAGWFLSTSTLPAATTDLYALASVYRGAGSITRGIDAGPLYLKSKPSWA